MRTVRYRQELFSMPMSYMMARGRAGIVPSMNRTQREQRIMRTFGRKLREARLQAGFRSAAKFAEHIGLEPPAYRKYERGDSSPNLETLTKICTHLGVTPNDLLPVAQSAA